MDCQIEVRNNTVLFQINGELSRVQDCISVSRQLRDFLDSGYRRVVLDLTSCTFVSASFCGFLAPFSGPDVRNFGILLERNSAAHRMLNIVGMDRTIRLYFHSNELTEIMGQL